MVNITVHGSHGSYLVWVMLHCLLTLVRTFFEVTRQRHLIMLSHESYIYTYIYTHSYPLSDFSGHLSCGGALGK